MASTPSSTSFIRSLTRSNVLVGVVLAVTMGLALALRLYGLDWDEGYGYTPHPDERAILQHVNELTFPPLGDIGVLLDAEESPWNPRWFPYGSFPLYLLKAVQIFTPGDQNDLRVIGRGLSGLADVATVFFVYLLAARLYGRREGLLAAALVSFAVIHIQLSHFFAVDTIVSLTTVAALYFMYRVATKGSLRDSLIAGAIVGLGVATKVSQAPIYLALVMAHLLYVVPILGATTGGGVNANQRLTVAFSGLLAAVGTSLLVFLLVQPYALLDWARFLGDVTEQSEMVRRIRDYPYTRQYIDTAPYFYHVRQLATFGLGWPLGIVAWVGLLYASLRGMRLHYGMMYLAVGWLMPMALLLYSTNLFAIGIASIMAFVALVATLPVRSAESRGNVLLLSWVVPYLLLTGAFQVKFTRYLIPVSPLLVIFGAQMMFHLWDRVASDLPSLKHVVTVVIVGLVAATGLYAIAYMSVYQEPYTAVRTSQWINQNAPQGSIILTEHWDEGHPDLGRYQIRTLPVYNEDGQQKLDGMVTDLAESDYIVQFSNRLYGTIPRLPERYPFTTAYFQLLFGGGLGYELANVETAYPSIAGINFVDDTYSRPGLPQPDGSVNQSGLNINLGFADESFSVYDHPKGMVFANVERLDESVIRERLVAATEGNTFATGGTPLLDTSVVGLMLSDKDLQAQREGGTWTDIVDPDGLGSRMPVPAWLLVMELMALAVLPIAFFVFRSLPDGGFLLAKVLGILAVSLVAWLLASLQWMAFSSGAVMVGLGVIASLSAVVLAFTWTTFWTFVRERWRILAISEIIFLAAFIAFVVVRMANPDLWHPWLGGEKPMDTAYLNAVLKSTYMPPYDPWYGGGYINYYYWGQFIVASFIQMTGINPVVAINLAVPMFFALTIGGAFSIVYNLAEGTRGKLPPKRAYVAPFEEIVPTEPVRPEPFDELRTGFVEGQVPQDPSADSLTLSGVKGLRANGGFSWSPVFAGIIAALFVAVIGNIDGAIQVGEGLFSVIFQNDQFGQFDFWRSSRMMPPDPPGLEITEFPFFTFLFADLHAHLMVIPFTLLVIGTSLAVVFSARDESRGSGVLARSGWGLSDLALVAVLGIAVGALRLINTWDYPTYLLLGMAAVLLAEILRNGGLSFVVIIRGGVKGILIAVIGFVAFLPYHASYETAFSSVESTTNQTVLWQFLAIAGLFVFIIGSFFIIESRGWLLVLWRPIWRRISVVIQVSDQGEASDTATSQSQQISLLRLAAIALGVVLVGMVFVLKLVEVTGSTVPFAFALVLLGAVVGLRHLFSSRPDAPQLAFVVLLALTALSIVIGLDVYRVEGDIDRMNTIFKFYLQIWVMLALASAYMLWRLGHGRSVPIRKLPRGKKVWLSGLAILVLCVSIYPFLGTQVRLRNRFDTTVTLTLDGAAYMQTEQEYFDPNGVIDLTADYEAIRWIQNNVEGSPLILEGLTPNYRWGGRISIYTGLPNIVGWGWHQEQQRWNYRRTVNQRIDKVARIYNTPSPSEALDIMREYGVEYVYLGELERLYYEPTGLAKFEDGFDGALEEVYQNRDVRIFRVREG